MKVIFTSLSEKQFHEFTDYISIENQTAAFLWGEQIIKKVNRLKIFPHFGTLVIGTGPPEVRVIKLKNYKVFYQVGSSSIHILSIRHAKQKTTLHHIVHARDYIVDERNINRLQPPYI